MVHFTQSLVAIEQRVTCREWRDPRDGRDCGLHDSVHDDGGPLDSTAVHLEQEYL